MVARAEEAQPALVVLVSLGLQAQTLLAAEEAARAAGFPLPEAQERQVVLVHCLAGQVGPRRMGLQAAQEVPGAYHPMLGVQAPMVRAVGEGALIRAWEEDLGAMEAME